MAAGFRSYVWDPCLIISQIVAVQCVYYLFLAFWVVFVDFSTGNSRSLDQFFSEEDIQFTSSRGKITMVAFCLNTLTGSVNNSTCLDFAATAHLIHLVNCCIYDGFPSSGSWWMLNLTCMALMAVIGEFVCMRTELKAIPVTVSSVKSS
ncbi:hypothetical protein pdam_00003661, partial [Pocillopora damicornis]